MAISENDSNISTMEAKDRLLRAMEAFLACTFSMEQEQILQSSRFDQILPKDALAISKWVYSMLKTAGIFITTGKAQSHVNKEILSSIGFYVSNCAMMDSEMKFGIIHHYVAMKLETPRTQPSLATLIKSWRPA